jgi:hypothetical protein
MSQAYVPHDLRRYFEGDWQLDRLAEDRRASTTHRMRGTAHFAPTERGLRYDEEVVWQPPGGPERAGARSYVWVLSAPLCAELRFPDGRAFHDLDLCRGTAEVTHACPPDRYDGRYCLLDADRFRVRWVVTGPRKGLVLSTLCVRLE